MSRHYVKVVDGVVIGYPEQLSESGSATPNTSWKPEQMKLHGFYEVDLSHDEVEETIDLDLYEIDGDFVVFAKVKKSSSEILDNSRNKKLIELNSKANNKIESLYSINTRINAALGLYPPQFLKDLKIDIAQILDSVESATVVINGLMTRKEIEDYKYDL